MSHSISIRNAFLKFRIYRNRAPALKEAVIGKLTRRNNADTVTEFDALKNINLRVGPGERLGIIGLNGAGKSTLLKMIVGIYPPHQGKVLVQGKITPLIELGTGFDYELSGRENIYLNGALLGRSYQQMRRLEDEIISFSELSEFIDLPIKYYSTGMHGRLAFSIGTIVEPEILLVDEIFATGDRHFVHKATERMLHLFTNSRIAVLVSHNLEQIEQLCNRVIVLNKGEIVFDDKPPQAINHYVNHVACLVNMPAEPANEPQLVS
jgi:ABC-type polysaccharide/polyol phosphate transport system ATPase subunit